MKTAHRPANKRRGAVIPQAILDRVLAIETHNFQQEAMQRFTEFSNSINGFEFDEDTISPTFDQSETFAKKFKFKDDPVDLNFLDCPSVPPDPNPVLISLRLSGSSELDSPDDGDLSDDVFKYINSMLMEENMEPKPSMFHDPLALKAIEKSLYDVIGEKYPDSPNQPPPYFNQNIESPNSLFGSSSEQSTNSNTNNSVDSQWIVNPEEYKPLVQSYPSGYPLEMTSQTTSQWSFGSLKRVSDNVNGPMDSFASSNIVSNIMSGSESIV